ncbi:MAG: hypothetical protein FWH05_08585 [Oscillospiraceae bacterium]|nr:hypothetical protein [Oscillospiraceae bacterium]
MSELIVDGISYKLKTPEGIPTVEVKDIQNKHSAALRLNEKGRFFIVSSTFPKMGKRYFEMLYVAEINKGRIWGN